MAKKHSQQIAYIYNTSGLVAEVLKNGEPLVKFFYNDRNQRVKKEHYAPNNFLFATTYYVRDVAGQVMAVYNDVGGDPALEEQPVYGAGRIGIAYNGNNNEKTYVYELTDHLGNVRAVFTKAENDANLEGYTDYYPFGMPMPNRTLLGPEGYRYAFQGQEKDPETGKEAFELRLWDGRIGRWLTTDPMGEFASPYLGMGNNPISRIDPTGGMTDCPDCADTIHLNEVVVTAPGNPTNFSDRFPTMGIVGAEHLKDPSQYITWDSDFKGNLNDYNLANNTNYGSEREAYADWNYTFNYAIPQRESIMAMHDATGEVAEFAMEMATMFVPVGKLGALGRPISRIIGNTRIPVYRVYGGAASRFGNYWTFVNPKLYGSTYRSFAGLPTLGRQVNSGAFLIKGSVQIKHLSNFGMAKRLPGTFGRLVPEVQIRNSWNTVNWNPQNVFRVNF